MVILAYTFFTCHGNDILPGQMVEFGSSKLAGYAACVDLRGIGEL